ncbi:sigma 54-interacting transcriptional regulator [Labilithrix luteola]|uniref:sigma 54-interacting transcriptional regulator n=1 Tax=Labilithrix luteola TaxID=1391654 RepID=UPI001473CC80|nr:sigma 54-interacting transcriptional regulator [Labilithrix luteola]
MALSAPLSLVSAPVSGSGGADTSRGVARGFVDLDERIVAPSPGVLIVRAPLEAHGSIIAHVCRRLRTSGMTPVEVSAEGRIGVPLTREIASQLGMGVVPTDPPSCASAIVDAAVTRRAAIVTSAAVSPWDRAVLAEMARVGGRSLTIVVLTTLTMEETSLEGTVFEMSGSLEPSDKSRWLGAIADEALVDLPAADIASLEAWWASARRASLAPPPSPRDLGVEARELLAALVSAGRSIPVATLQELVAPASIGPVVDELVREGAVVHAGGFVTVLPAFAKALEADVTDAARLAAAKMLGGSGFESDPWAFARAAELHVAMGRVDDADALIGKAIAATDGSEAARELTARWFTAVTRMTDAGGLALRVRTAERLLAMGEASDAQRWCESAAALRPGDPEVSLLMGRALMQLGDVVASRVALGKALASADSDELRARISADLAEVSYLAGDRALAKEYARSCINLAATSTTRLAGRNALGKVHLAEARWDEADEHFAEDALTASAAGEVIAELRARLNRAIALMSKGMLEDSRTALERVLEDGTRIHQHRACAHAHSNLAVIAYRRHDYAAALAHWEATTRYPQALRGRIASARTLANLAELRLRLGLVEHADHAVAFGRRILGGRAAAVAASHLAVVAAGIAVSRGNTALARREVDAAIVDAEAANDLGDRLPEAFLASVRVALEDGDLQLAADTLAKAEARVTNLRGRAEVAILRSLYRRALGQESLESAEAALALARTSGEEDLLFEIHVLLANIHRDAGDLHGALAHCSRATVVRDQVASGLSSEVRAAFLAKGELVALSRLQASLANHESGTLEEEAPRSFAASMPASLRPEPSSREIIGDDPQMRALNVAIRKVARSNSTVLIRGESGTGKELVADALHRASDRATGPLVSVNCAALVETLLLSELFGHEKGAFTGASARRRGRFEMAEGGTLFLDEIGDISARTQVALLRVLQERTFERVGGTQAIRANVRVVCATHRDLKAMVERGEFREDLYYRLRGITLEVPALRARLGDLPKIAEHLLHRIGVERNEEPKSLTHDAVELLCRHRWPGNIRELENVLRAVSLFAEGRVIGVSDLIDNVEDLRVLAQAGPVSQGVPMSVRANLLPAPTATLSTLSGNEFFGDDDSDDSGALPESESGATAVAYAQVRQGAVSLSDMKRQIERDCIARALAETKGNITRAASLLGMKRPRLSQLVKQYGLSASSEGSQ